MSEVMSAVNDRPSTLFNICGSTIIILNSTQFNGLSSHKSPVAQWSSIQTSDQKVIGLTPVGRT